MQKMLQQKIANQRRQLNSLTRASSGASKTRKAAKSGRSRRRRRANGGSSNAPPSRSSGLMPSAFGAIGRSLGGLVGLGGLGQSVGSGVGRFFSSVTGMGDYKVQGNSLVGDTGPPEFKTSGNGEVIICHREFISDISSSTSFTNSAFSINPGLSATFPWLSTVAASYQQYQFLGLIFEFKSTSAVALNSTNTALGTVVMSTQYDALASNFSNKVAMEEYEYTVSGPPSQSLLHPVECDPKQNVMREMYIRSTNQGLPSSSDRRFYDLGTFQLATVGMQAANTIGELWVSYQVRLIKPQIAPTVGAFIPIGHARIGANLSTTGPFNGLVNVNSQYAIQLSNPGGTTNLSWSYTAGATYLVLVVYVGPTVNTSINSWALSGTGVNLFNNGTSGSFVCADGKTNATGCAVTRSTSGPFSIQLTLNSVATDTLGDVFVMQVPTGYGLDRQIDSRQTSEALDWLSKGGLDVLRALTDRSTVEPDSPRPTSFIEVDRKRFR